MVHSESLLEKFHEKIVPGGLGEAARLATVGSCWPVSSGGEAP